MKFSILTLGCKVNQSESDSIERSLMTSGHALVDISENPDICIVNTCTVTAKSDYQSRQYIRSALRTGAQVFVTGCYAQLNSETIGDISNSINVISNEEKDRYFNDKYIVNGSNTLPYNLTRSRAFIKIQDGCNNRCTYCAIHMARGRSRSVQQDLIIQSVKDAFDSGINEAVLTGVHIGMYGADLQPGASLAGLIKDILQRTRIPRIRLSSLEVNEIDDELLELLGDNRVCKHLHIPLQSGDDRILDVMGRRYTTEAYSARIDEIQSLYSEISVGTDVIVGFPGEDDASFEKSFAFIEETGFSYLHVFPFSKRRMTPAYNFKDDLEPIVKQERVMRLRAMSERKKREYMSRFIGGTVDLIVENEIGGEYYSATSGNYLKVILNGQALKKGSMVSGRIRTIENGKLLGELA